MVKHPTVRCPNCGKTMRWKRNLFNAGTEAAESGYDCECNYSIDLKTATELGLVTDDRIRHPEDVVIRLRHAAEIATVDVRLDDSCRDQLALYHELGDDHTSIQVCAADGWVAHKLDINISKVRRNRAKLEKLYYVKRIRPKDVVMFGLKAWVTNWQLDGKRVPVLLELLRGPNELPVCPGCGKPLDKADRAHKLYHNAACKSKAARERADATR